MQICFIHFASSENLNVAGHGFRFPGRGAGSVAQAGGSVDQIMTALRPIRHYLTKKDARKYA